METHRPARDQSGSPASRPAARTPMKGGRTREWPEPKIERRRDARLNRKGFAIPPSPGRAVTSVQEFMAASEALVARANGAARSHA